MTAIQPRRLTMKSTQDLVEAVPLFLSFHPHNSFVMVALPTATGVAHAFGGRIDLPETVEDITDCLASFLGPARRNHAQRVILYVYDDHEEWPPLLDIANAMFESEGIAVVDLIHVHHGVGHSKKRPEDHAIIAQPGQIAAQGVADGHVTEASREAYVTRVASTVDPRLFYPTSEITEHDARAYVEWIIDRIGREELTVEQVASLAAALHDPDARDRLLQQITTATVPGGEHWWASVARNTPSCPETQHLFGPIALGLYLHGTTPLAWAVLERAPVHTFLVDVAHKVLGLGLDPNRFLEAYNRADEDEEAGR